MDCVIERTNLLPKSGVGLASHWLVVAPPGNPVIRLDLRALDQIRVGSPRCDVILVCGDLEIAIYVADGPAPAERVVREAVRFTRESTGLAAAADVSQLLIIGNDAVLERGDYIQIGSVAFRTSEVRDYALRGANLPFPDGSLLQAAMAMLVVACAARDAATAGRSECE